MDSPERGCVQAAARGIIARLGDPVRPPVQIYAAGRKRPLAEALLAELAAGGLGGSLHLLTDEFERDPASPTGVSALQHAAAHGSLVMLAEPAQAPWLFDTIGRPDRGLHVPPDHLYCDWLLPYDSLLHILSVDYARVRAWRERLLVALQGATHLCVQTGDNAELTLAPRAWIVDDGELFTAPHETSVQGTLAVDGALYGSPPRRPIVLKIVDGRVTHLDALDGIDPQQRMLFDDLTRDENANQVAELGLGINPGARAHANIMEAEMALGSCHVGFGHNLAYGGANASAIHTDVGVLRPTITVDGRLLCRAGRYVV